MTGVFETLRRDGPRIALAAVGVLAVVVVGYGVFLASLRYLVPLLYPLVPAADPGTAAVAIGVVPTVAYAVVVGVLVRRRVVAES